MAWQDEMTAILRPMLNDVDEAAQAFTDDRLEGALVVAARLVSMEMSFPGVYLADASAVSITPDPTVAPDRDENFINLTCVKAACIIDHGSAIRAASQTIMVQDGRSKVDLRDQYKARLALMRDGWCAVYAEMRDQYVTSQSGVGIGAAIMTPFRIYAGYDPQFGTGYRWPR